MTTLEVVALKQIQRDIQEIGDNYRKVLAAFGLEHGSGEELAAEIYRLQSHNAELQAQVDALNASGGGA
jgi:hypothetical protein